jgi:hypothetical protein
MNDLTSANAESLASADRFGSAGVAWETAAHPKIVAREVRFESAMQIFGLSGPKLQSIGNSKCRLIT